MSRYQLQPSGALIVIGDETVYKSGSPGPVADRVTAQGRWLLSRTRETDRPYLPRVYTVAQGWYMMEKLRRSFYELSDVNIVPRMLGPLSGLWYHDEPQDIDWSHHHKKVDDLLNHPTLRRYHDVIGNRFSELRDAVDFDSLTSAYTTHGDPTLDNVLMRDDQIVLTDPIPPSPGVPSVIAVDLGKMLQSFYGWERIRHPDTHEWRYVVPSPPNVQRVIDVTGSLVDPVNELRGAYYMCAVHYLRLLSYHPHIIHESREVLSRVIDDGLRS